ncbi:Endonuclease/exonuclease/phosphatase [Xylariales sp. PMI_506]|nr:Endonuclease/exonuclease/phosphatase [Xylariales sp. PMI_506]
METLPPELSELNIITLNCWGLLHLSAERAARLTAIGRAIASASPTPHIVALQECWTQEDYRAIRRATRFVLPYGKFYFSGVFGGGLAILSRWPIEESTMFHYPLNGRPTAFFRGDWYVGKGVACAKIRYGKGLRDVVEVFNTHTHSPYHSDPYLAHRLSQAWELAKLVRGAAARGHLVLVMGDLNDVPLSLPYQILAAHAPVRDVWRVLHPDSSVGAAEDEAERARRRPIPTAQFNIDENGVTSNSAYNTWRWPKSEQRKLGPGPEKQWPSVAPDALDHRGKRLDYIFASSGAREDEQPTRGWVVHDARVGMLDRHPDLGCSLSDHFSVEATLVLYQSSKAGAGGGSNTTSTVASPLQHQHHHQGSQGSQVQSNNPLHHRRSSSLLNTNPSRLSAPYPTVAASVAETRGSTEIADAVLSNGVYLQSPSNSETHLPAGPTQPHLRSPTGSGGLPHPGAGFTAQLKSLAQPAPHLPSSAYDEILTHIHAYLGRERFQRRWRAIHFATWVVVALVCWVGVWFSPRYVSFVLCLLSSLGLAAGVVDGLIALLFMGSEIRALKEFEWEIMNAKATASGAAGPALDVSEDGDQDNNKRW